MRTKTMFEGTKRMLSMNETCAYVGMGKNCTRKLMNDIGATKHIGKRVLFDKKIIDTYLDNLQQSN